jgi:molybdopterin converting factor small subunit
VFDIKPINVKVSVSSWFRRFTGGKEELELKLAPGTSALCAAVKAGVPGEEIGFVTVNNIKADKEQILNNGDILRIFPYIIGG